MAVGIFDSGLGGLTVLEAVTKRLPDVPFVYYGDNAHTPYGVRDADDIYALTTAGVDRLFQAGCDLVILACNTASAAALRRMQEGWVPEGKRVLGVFVPPHVDSAWHRVRPARPIQTPTAYRERINDTPLSRRPLRACANEGNRH